MEINSTTFIGTLSQTITYGTILPFYLFLHVLTSPTNLGSPPSSPSKDIAADFDIDPAALAAWAPAFTLSYLIPTILVAFPSPKFTSFSMHQVIMALWEFYPVPFKLFQLGLASYVVAPALSRTTSRSSSAPAQQRATTLNLLKWTYAFAALVGGVSHVITCTLSFSAAFFPSLFTADASSSLSPPNIFVPVAPWQNAKAANLGEGLWWFLGWNMGVSNVAPLVWGVVQLHNAASVKRKGWEGWPVVLAKVGGLTAIGGPGVGVAWLLWKRDEIVMGVEAEEQKKAM